MMKSMFLICLGFMAFCGLLMKQLENLTHLSHALYPLRYLRVGLCGDTYFIYDRNITYHSRGTCSHRYQGLGLCMQTTLSQDIEMISTHCSNMCAETNSLYYYGLLMRQTENFTQLSQALDPLRYLGVGLCGENTFIYHRIYASFASLLMVATFCFSMVQWL